MDEKNQNIVDDYINYLKVERQYSNNTIESYKADIEQFAKFTNENFLLITESKVIEYVEFLRKKYSENSLLRKFASVKNFYKYLVSIDRVLTNPLANINIKKTEQHLPDYLSQEEINVLLNSLNRNTKIEARNKAMLELLYASGIRVSELINIKVEHLNLKEKYLKVKGKGNKERIIPLTELCASELEIYYYQTRKEFLINDKDSDYLFLNNRGSKMSRQGFYKIIKNKGEMVGIYDLSPHKLRHSIATHLLNNGVNLKMVQELLGHSDISTTQIYTHTSKQKINKEYQRHHVLGKEKNE